MRDLPAVEVSWRDVPQEEHDLAIQAAYWGWKHAGIAEPVGKIRRRETFLVKWFEPDGKRLGQYDEALNHIWLSTSLLGNPEEIERTVFHELGHAKQFAEGLLFTEPAAEVVGEWLLKAWTVRTEELEAKAAEAKARRVMRPVFPGRSDVEGDVEVLQHLYGLPASPEVAPAWSYDRIPRRRD